MERVKRQPCTVCTILRKGIRNIWINQATHGGLIFPIIYSLQQLLTGDLIEGKQTSLLVYNPGSSTLPTTALDD